MQEEINNPIKDFKDKTAEYLELRVELLKLEIFEKSSQLSASLAVGIITIILIMFFALSLFLALAFYIGQQLHNYAQGFLYSGLVYLIILILFILFGRNSIKKYVTNKVIKLFNTTADEEE